MPREDHDVVRSQEAAGGAARQQCTAAFHCRKWEVWQGWTWMWILMWILMINCLLPCGLLPCTLL